MKTGIIRYDTNEPEHRAAVRRIVWDTGFGGDTMDPFFDDPALFADMLTLYYTDFDPGHNFIAVADGEVAGYLLGCPDTKLYEKRMKKEVFPHMLRKLAAGRYRPGRLSRRFIGRNIGIVLRGELTHPPLDRYPAHLHIDFDARFRRAGLGSRLINAYFDHLRGLGVRGVHLGTSSFHYSALPFYSKLGFSEFSRIRLKEHFYLEVTREDMYSITYVKSL